MDGIILLGSATLSGGQVAFTTSGLSTTTHNNIHGVYVGSTNYSTSNSNVLSHTVSKASTSTALSSSSNPYTPH
jgi:hypothetical protein